MIVSMNVSHFVKICQVLTLLHQLICRGVANFGTRCTCHTKKGNSDVSFRLPGTCLIALCEIKYPYSTGPTEYYYMVWMCAPHNVSDS